MKIWSFRPVFLIVVLLGALALSIIFSIYEEVETRLIVVGAFLAALTALVADMLVMVERRIGAMEELSSKLSTNDNLRRFYMTTIGPLESAYENTDTVFRELMEQRLREAIAPLRSDWREWKLVYRGELWRNAYRQVLDEDDVHDYKSIAWIKSNDYWQDPPGREAFRYNRDLVNKKNVQRIFLVRRSVMDSDEVKNIIRADRSAGITVSVAIEENVPEELRHDLGIYGKRAVGYQFTDDRSQTDRFELLFDPEEVQIANTRFAALERWSLTEQELEHFLIDQSSEDHENSEE